MNIYQIVIAVAGWLIMAGEALLVAAALSLLNDARVQWRQGDVPTKGVDSLTSVAINLVALAVTALVTKIMIGWAA